MWYVYIIRNESGDLYFGCTNNLKRRITEHNKNKSYATKDHIWKLIYYEAYISKEDAFDREHKIKHHGQAKRRLKERLKSVLTN